MMSHLMPSVVTLAFGIGGCLSFDGPEDPYPELKEAESGAMEDEALLTVTYLSQHDLSDPDVADAACSSASAAMILAYHGKVASDHDTMVATAEEVFSQTASVDNGLEGRDQFGDYLMDTWEFSSVYFDDAYWDDLYATIQEEVSAGRPLILGTRSINSAGHYMVLVGYSGADHESAIIVAHDPYGIWRGYDDWDTASSGENVEYDFTEMTGGADDGVFVIQP